LNFVREQRWPIFVLLLWVVLLAVVGLFADLPRERDDLLFIFKQIAIYVICFSVFFGASAIYNERSHGAFWVCSQKLWRVTNIWQDSFWGDAGLRNLLFRTWVTATWTLGGAGFPISQVWFLMLCLVAACVLAGTVL